MHRRLPCRRARRSAIAVAAARDRPSRAAAEAVPAGPATAWTPYRDADDRTLGHTILTTRTIPASRELQQSRSPDLADQLALRRWADDGGRRMIQPDGLGHAANFLYMLTGERSGTRSRQGLRRRDRHASRLTAGCVQVRGARRGGNAHQTFSDLVAADSAREGDATRRRKPDVTASVLEIDRPGRSRRPKRSYATSSRVKEKIRASGTVFSFFWCITRRISARRHLRQIVARSRSARGPADLVRESQRSGAREGRTRS